MATHYAGPGMTLDNMRALGVRSIDVTCGCGRKAIIDEAARYRFSTSMRDLENAFDAKASELRAAFVREVSAHVAATE